MAKKITMVKIRCFMGTFQVMVVRGDRVRRYYPSQYTYARLLGLMAKMRFQAAMVQVGKDVWSE